MKVLKMRNTRNKFKYAPLVVTILLAACGGGGSGGGVTRETSTMTNDLNVSGAVDIEAGQGLAIKSRATVARSSITSHVWTITQVSGETVAAANAPTIADANCATAAKQQGSASTAVLAGATGVSDCQTILAVPASAKPGEWAITNVATSTDGSSSSNRFTLSVKLKSASTSGFSIIVSKTPQIQELNKLAQLSSSYVVSPGVKVDSVKYSWTQVSGTPVNLAGANTPTASFIAATSGEYVFRVKITATINGREEIQEGDTVLNVANAVTITYFDVDAGNVQLGKLQQPVQLTGKVMGNATVGTLDYTWSQVSGPQQVVFANANSLNASFIPQASGTYVFQLKVNSAAGFKTATTSVAIEAQTPTFFALQAGDVQIGKLATPTQLTGKVTGTTDPATLNYEWSQVSGPATGVIANVNTLNASFIPNTSGTYVFQLKAGNADGFKVSNTTIAVAAAAPVPTPFFAVSSGDAQQALPNAIVLLKGAVALGTPPPTNIKYQWTQTAGPAAIISNATSLQASFVVPSAGSYAFQLTGTSDGITSTSQTSISVSPIQNSFEVQAGNVQVGKLSVPVLLTGTVTGAVDPSTLNYEWTQVSGPATAVLSNQNTRNASFIPTVSGTYVFQLQAGNANGFKTSNTTVAIDATASTTPFFAVSSGDTQRALLNAIVVLKGTVASGTPAPSNITYLWTQTGGAAVSLSNANSLQASFSVPSSGTYTFRLTATSDGVVKTSDTNVIVDVISNSATIPFFIVSAGDAQLAQVNKVVLLKGAIASGSPAPDNITYQWVQKSGPAVVLSNPTSLQASFVPPTIGQYAFEVTATAGGISKTSNTTVSVQ